MQKKRKEAEELEEFMKLSMEEKLAKYCYTITSQQDVDESRNIVIGDIYIGFRYFTHLLSFFDCQQLADYALEHIRESMTQRSKFRLHVSIENVYIKDLEKRRPFVEYMAKKLKEIQGLEVCYIYNAPFFFRQILYMITRLMTRDVLEKIKVVKTAKNGTKQIVPAENVMNDDDDHEQQQQANI